MRETPPDRDAATSPTELSSLSPREREVLDAALEGLSARDIARRLSLTEATVRSHLSAIYSKLRVANRVQLLALLNRNAQPMQAPTTQNEPRTPESRRPRWRSRRVFAFLAILAVAFIGTAYLATRLSSARGSDLQTVSQLIASNAVAHVDLSGSTLTITEKNGDQVQVDSVSLDDFDLIQQAAISASIPVSASSATHQGFGASMAFLGTLLIPVVLVVGVVVGVARLMRRPPSVRPAS